MSVAKIIELNAASKTSMEDAVKTGLKKCAESVKGIKGAWVNEIKVVTDDNGNDSIAIRSLVHLTLGYDHRIIDGAVADQFMAEVKKALENWSEEIG